MKRDFGSLGGKTFDVIVVGGGIMGTGIARDAALRGLDTLLLEKEDYAHGTTSRSTRLIHGGLRYLSQFEFKLVRQDMREREILLKIATHLVHPLRFLVPMNRPIDRLALPVGMLLYDLLSFDKSVPGRHRVSAREITEMEPDLKMEEAKGAYIYYDCQVPFPERLSVENVISATENGATAINHARVTGLLRSGNSASGVELEDSFSGERYQAKSKVVINATGHWMDDVQKSFGTSSRQMIRRTKGVHLVTPKLSNNAIVSFAHADGRLFFIIPWHGLSLIGTTDTDFPGDPDHVYTDTDDVSYLLTEAQCLYPSLKREDIMYTNAGLRALVLSSAQSASNTSRAHKLVDHERTDGLSNYISLLGGKITGYRSISEETVNIACKKLEHATPCRTAKTPLPGMPPVTPEEIAQASQQSGLPESTVTYLAGLYGSRYSEIIEMTERDPGGKEPLCPHCQDIVAQVWHAVEKESAITVSDFMLRRGTAGFASCQGLDSTEAVAREMGKLLGWSDDEQKHQMEEYGSLVARNNAWK